MNKSTIKGVGLTAIAVVIGIVLYNKYKASTLPGSTLLQ